MSNLFCCSFRLNGYGCVENGGISESQLFYLSHSHHISWAFISFPLPPTFKTLPYPRTEEHGSMQDQREARNRKHPPWVLLQSDEQQQKQHWLSLERHTKKRTFDHLGAYHFPHTLSQAWLSRAVPFYIVCACFNTRHAEFFIHLECTDLSVAALVNDLLFLILKNDSIGNVL